VATEQSSIGKARGLRPRDLKRIGKAVARVERERGGGTRPIYDRRQFQGNLPLVLTGIVSTTITARIGNALGVGAVTLCETSIDDVTGAGTEAPTGDVIAVYNSFGVIFAAHASKRIKIHWEGGCWKVLVFEC
jgi:hypothetical protein